MNWLERGYTQAVEKQIDETGAHGDKGPGEPPPTTQPASVRALARMTAQGVLWGPMGTREVANVETVLLLFWPVVWVVWAFLFRGGLTYLMMGLALVRGNGRPAMRVPAPPRRTFPVWAPVAGADPRVGVAGRGLLVGVAQRRRATLDAGGVLRGLVGGACPVAVYAALAVWLPRRSLHDWLAGTHVVPR